MKAFASTVEVREFQTQDRSAVVLLWNQLFPNATGHNDPNTSLDRKLEANDGLLFVAVEDDAVIGTVMAGYDGHRGWIYSVGVDPRYQRRGVGTHLVRHTERELMSLGCPKINLQVRTDNAEVVAFYATLGFETEDRISMGKRPSF